MDRTLISPNKRKGCKEGVGLVPQILVSLQACHLLVARGTVAFMFPTAKKILKYICPRFYTKNRVKILEKRKKGMKWSMCFA